MTRVMERSPSAFVKAAEETIRDHILVQLNGQFEGNAMGEVFNAAGTETTEISQRAAGGIATSFPGTTDCHERSRPGASMVR